MLHHLRHRTASGDLDNIWEFCPVRVQLDIVMRVASARPIALTVPVCAVDRPRAWAHPIQRLDGESWRILPTRWKPAVSSTPGHYEDCALHESVGYDLLLLTNAPDDVNLELESL